MDQLKQLLNANPNLKNPIFTGEDNPAEYLNENDFNNIINKTLNLSLSQYSLSSS